MKSAKRVFLKTTAAAEYIGIKPNTLAKWCKSDNPPIPFFFDGVYRFDQADLDKYLEGIYVPAGPRNQGAA